MENYSRIKLTNMSFSVLVDNEDYEALSQRNWHLSKRGYICSPAKVDGKPVQIYMHRMIMNAPKGMDVDHIDGNRINNRRSNLRLATRSENMANVRKVKKDGAHSKYKGVSKLKRPNLTNPYLAYIKVDYKTYYLGYYPTEDEAAHMYNQFAEQVYGEFASLNDID